jgi:hypothetical protein
LFIRFFFFFLSLVARFRISKTRHRNLCKDFPNTFLEFG